eukprot:6506420-Ditylum_brightwellii.AAC.1
MPYFTGVEGIECLLYVEEQYRSVACQLQFLTRLAFFDNFEEVLTGTAEEKWESLVNRIVEVDKMPERFNLEMGGIYQCYFDEEV